MGSSNPESIGEVFHKKKEAKKKQEAKGQLPIDQLDNRTIGEGSTTIDNWQQPIAPEVEGQLDNRQAKLARTRNQLINFEIDEYLIELLTSGMIEEQYIAYYAKACHTLGIATINRLKVNAINGDNPKRLFAYKVSGALKLYYKRQYLNS